MSANFPPPQTGGQNPFGRQPGGNPYGQQPPYGAPQGAPGYGQAPFAPAPVAQGRDNVGLGLVVGAVVAIVVALAYGGLLRALAKDDGTTVEFRYAAVAIGALVGIAAGKVGGRNIAIPVFSALFALFAVVFGELFGGALVISHYASAHGVDLSVSDIFLHHFGDLWKAWKSDFGASRFIFLVFAAFAAFGLAKRFGEG